MGRVYVIAGASASGKSTVARKLSSRSSLPLVALDRVWDILSEVIEEEPLRADATKAVCREMIKQLVLVAQDCIVEGGWINPSEAKEVFGLAAETSVIFCGYNDGDLPARLARILETKEHWLRDKSAEEGMQWLQEQASKSQSHYRTECNEHSLKYFDFSSFDDGETQVFAHFDQWRALSS